MPGELPTLEQRIEALLRAVALEVRPCRACGQKLAIVRHWNGKRAPYTLDGINHFINCPKSDLFRTKKGGPDAGSH